MTKFNLIASCARWAFVGFSVPFLLYQNYETKKELRMYKSSYIETVLDVTEIRLMLRDFSEMAPREMKRIAKEAVKEELTKLTNLE